MTPRGILENLEVGMISITDHNCCGNARTFWKVCRERKVIFLPGIEITSIEEVHILGYFENLEDLERVSKIVYEHLPNVKNDPELFGYQLLVDEKDEFTGMIEKNLSLATDLRFEEVIELIRRNKGIPVPAHVDRRFGLLHQLGFIPDLDLKIIEVTRRENMVKFRRKGYIVLSSSDAHSIDELGSRYSIFPDGIRCTIDVLKNIAEGKIKTIWDTM